MADNEAEQGAAPSARAGVGQHPANGTGPLRHAHTAMGQAGPDYEGLTFHHWTDVANRRTLHFLDADHPEHGEVGSVQYVEGPGRVSIHNMEIEPEHRRRGVASALMRELERRHPDTVIDHGHRTPEGKAWADRYYGPEHTRDTPVPDEGGDPLYPSRPTRNRQQYEAMGAAGPDYEDLSFQHRQLGLGMGELQAHHPEHGQVGRLQYQDQNWDPGSHLSVEMLIVPSEHKRRGVATALMGELERRHPGALIQHGTRTMSGADWAASYYGPGANRWGGHGVYGKPTRDRTVLTAAMQARDYEGETGRNDHITRGETGELPIDAVRHLSGARGERPGEHRNRGGDKWEAFKADIAAHGIRTPIFITVDHGEAPKISEGNHRRDAAIELGLSHIPAEVRYFGHAEHQGTVEQRAGRNQVATRTAAVQSEDYRFGYGHGLIGAPGNKPIFERRRAERGELHPDDENYLAGHAAGTTESQRRERERAERGQHRCPECRGSGEGPWKQSCPSCHGSGAISAEQAHSTDVLYHVTDRPNFRPDPKHVPEDNALAITSRERPGLFAASGQGVSTWTQGHGYVRPYVAELHVPRLAHEPGRWGGERFIPAEHLDKVRVNRVIPLSAHQDEQWEGKPYTGPDARVMSQAEHHEHKEHALGELRERGSEPEDIEHLRQHWAAYTAGAYSDALQSRHEMDADASARGHDMQWQRGRSGDKPGNHFHGECRHCGATMMVGSTWFSTDHPRRDARSVECTGPGTKWQSDMQRELSAERFQQAVSQFGQDVKDAHDRQWLHGQGIEASRHTAASPTDPAKLGRKHLDDIRAMVHAVRSHECHGGQCGFTSENLAREHGWPSYGGIYHTPDGRPIGDHVWNVHEPSGTIIDSTADQFGEGHDVRVLPPSHPDHARYRHAEDEQDEERKLNQARKSVAKHGDYWWVPGGVKNPHVRSYLGRERRYKRGEDFDHTAAGHKVWYHGTSVENAQNIVDNGARARLNLITAIPHANGYARIMAKFHSPSGRGVVLEGRLDGDEEEHPWDRDPQGKAFPGIAVTSRPNAFTPTHWHEVPAWERGEEPVGQRHPISEPMVAGQHTAAADWHEFRRVQDTQQRQYERPGIGGSQEDRDRYFGTGQMMGRGQERLVSPKDWITHSRAQQLRDTPPEFQENWRGHQLGRQHGQGGAVRHEELDAEYARSPHPDHFAEGYAEGLEEVLG